MQFASEPQFDAVAQQKEMSAEGRRYIAVHHRLEIEIGDGDLQKAWESANAFCQTIKCEVVSSSFSNQTRSSANFCRLSVRVAPEDVQKFFGSLGKSGNVVQHTTENVDKTAAVI